VDDREAASCDESGGTAARAGNDEHPEIVSLPLTVPPPLPMSCASESELSHAFVSHLWDSAIEVEPSAALFRAF